jgi:hypothetical protein
MLAHEMLIGMSLGTDVAISPIVLGNHPKAAIDNHFKTGHREGA